jgi:hypothetical protein
MIRQEPEVGAVRNNGEENVFRNTDETMVSTFENHHLPGVLDDRNNETWPELPHNQIQDTC